MTDQLQEGVYAPLMSDTELRLHALRLADASSTDRGTEVILQRARVFHAFLAGGQSA